MVEKPFYTIRELSIEIERSMDTLRRWDQLGLLTANRDASGYRYYLPKQREQARALAARDKRKRG
jgi:DNA-binding transcriptional MerR regulator